MAIVTRNQPQGYAPIDRSNPLANGLAGAFYATSTGLLTTEGKIYPPTGPGIKTGVGAKGYASQYVSGTADSFQLSPANSTTTVWDSPSSQVSVMVLVRKTGIGGGNSPIFANNSPQTAPFTPWGLTDKSGTGQMLFGIGSGAGTIVEIFEPTNGMADNAFHLYIGTYDGATMLLYRDGQLVASGATSGGLNYFNASDRGTSVGNYYSFAGTRTFVGEVYTGGLWKRALTPAEVASLTANPWQLFRAPQFRPLRATATGSNGALAWLEQNDTTAISAAINVSVSAAWTEANDTTSIAASARVTASASWTESSDTLTASGTVGSAVSITAAWTETPDIISVSASAQVNASASWIEQADSTALTGTVGNAVTASASWTEASDTTTISATASISGSASWTEASDVTSIAASAGNTVSGNAIWTEQSDSAAIAVSAKVSATAAWTETSDTSQLSGSVGNAVAGNASWTEQSDTAALTAAAQVIATASWTETADTIQVSASVGSAVAGNASWTEQADTIAILSTIRVTASAGWAEQSDTTGFSAQVLATAGFSWTEASDTATITASVSQSVSGALSWVEQTDYASYRLTINPKRIYVGRPRIRTYTG